MTSSASTSSANSPVKILIAFRGSKTRSRSHGGKCKPSTAKTSQERSPRRQASATRRCTTGGKRGGRNQDYIGIPYSFYRDLLSVGPLGMARPDQRAALLAVDTADAEALERALSSAFADFDRNRSLMGEIAGATPSAVEVKAIHPTLEVKLLRQRQGGSTGAGKGRGTRSGEPVEERSRRTPNRGPTQATTRSRKNTRNARRPSPGVRGSRR